MEGQDTPFEFDFPEHANMDVDVEVEIDADGDVVVDPSADGDAIDVDGGGNDNGNDNNGIVSKPRAACWKHFHYIQRGEYPRAACNWCKKEYACHSVKNGTFGMTSHFKLYCTKCPESKKFMGSKQKILSFKNVKQEDGTASAKLVPVSFSVEASTKALSRMVIIDELPFSFVEGEGFLEFMSVVQPKWVKIPSRITIAKKCMLIFQEEKKSLKRVLKNQRLCLTTDTWTSVQNLNYMCLTGHWIDENWKYQKRILNFCVVSSHKGEILGKIIEECLGHWGIDKILTVTVDNASSNNLLIDYLRTVMRDRKTTILKHDLMHVRRSAHILNMIVREGLSEIELPIARVRNVVKYVRSSPSRMAEFWRYVEKEIIECKLKPCLDVATHWNYTYFMLDRALVYRAAFGRLCNDTIFKLSLNEAEQDDSLDDIVDLGEVEGDYDGGEEIEIERGRGKAKGRGKGKPKRSIGPPTYEDWEKIKVYVQFLRMFYLATLRFSGSLYVTCHTFFDELVLIQDAIHRLSASDDDVVGPLARGMSAKFDKYWGKFEKLNPLLLYAVILDPRYKMKYVEFCFQTTLGHDIVVVNEMKTKITKGLTKLFEWYVKNNVNGNLKSLEVGGSLDGHESLGGDDVYNGDSLKSKFKMHLDKETNMASKTELEKYLVEGCEDDNKFNLLSWWKGNSLKYPILSQVARDVLAVPVSTVASESAFSTGGRVLDPYRSSLAPKTVEALICAQQWLRKPKKINLRKQLDELAQLDIVLMEGLSISNKGKDSYSIDDST